MPVPFTPFLTYIPLLDWDKKELERETTSTPNFQQYTTDTVQRRLLYTISKQQQEKISSASTGQIKESPRPRLRPVDGDDDISTGSRVELVSTGGGANKQLQPTVLHPSTSALLEGGGRAPEPICC